MRCAGYGSTAQELREHDICVNGYAPGTIQTDLGMLDHGSMFPPLVVSGLLTPFIATEAEKVAGDKTVQEVSQVAFYPILGGCLSDPL